MEKFIHEIFYLHFASRDETLKKSASNTIVKIGASETLLLLETVGMEVSNITEDKRLPSSVLEILGAFIDKHYITLTHMLPVVIEVILRALDPHDPGLRKSCIDRASDSFQKLVVNLPMVAFHHGKQRLALGTTEGTIIVYDLRTATRSKVFEEHKGGITSVEFNKSGALLASYCMEDNTVRTWKVDSGSFLGNLLSKSTSKSVKVIELHPV